jgi:anti-sigma regulatory factor (Ser/Thr protein kinase)
MPYYRCAGCALTVYGTATYSTVGVCPNCSASLADAARLDLSPATGQTTKRVLESRPQAASEARRAVTTLPLPQETRTPLLLLVSELVNNAVLHAGSAGTPVELEITVSSERVRVEVHDGGDGFDVPSSDLANPLLVGGQGLAIVAGLSDAWGVERDAGGCTVWCELLVEARAAEIEHAVTSAYVRELAVDMVRLAPGGAA